MRIAAGPFADAVAPISRIVPTMSTNTTASTTSGIAVHAISSLVFPWICGAGPATRDARYRQAEYRSAASTPMKMRNAMAPTTSASPPIASADVLTTASLGRWGHQASPAAAVSPRRGRAPRRPRARVRSSCRRPAAHARRDERGHEREERDPEEHQDPDGGVAGHPEQGGQRRDRLRERARGIPRSDLHPGHRDERADGHRDGRVVDARLERAHLSLELLDLDARRGESALDLEDLVDGVRAREEREVLLLLGLLRAETCLHVDELIGHVLGVDVRRHDLAVQLLQLRERVVESARRDADGDERAALVAGARLRESEQIATQARGDRADLVGGRPRILRAEREVRGQDEIPTGGH